MVVVIARAFCFDLLWIPVSFHLSAFAHSHFDLCAFAQDQLGTFALAQLLLYVCALAHLLRVQFHCWGVPTALTQPLCEHPQLQWLPPQV